MIGKNYIYGLMAAACFVSTPVFAGGNTYGLGIEGFHEDYKEQSLDNEGKTNGGSITGYFSHQMNSRLFFTLDGRASYGTQDFTSTTGSVSGIPQWEFDLRARLGKTYQVWGGEMSPYVGVGLKYNMSQAKGYITDLGFEDYDRETTQLYIPIGASYSIGFGDGWSITPQAEADIMAYANTDSRLTNLFYGEPVSSSCSPVVVSGCSGIQFLSSASNNSWLGFGGRGELMFGKSMGDYSLQAGPFVRYMYVPESDKVPYQNVSGTGPTTINYTVPKNTDLQAGVGLRILFH